MRKLFLLSLPLLLTACVVTYEKVEVLNREQKQLKITTPRHDAELPRFVRSYDICSEGFTVTAKSDRFIHTAPIMGMLPTDASYRAYIGQCQGDLKLQKDQFVKGIQ